MGPLLVAWHILRQSHVATDEDRKAVNAWMTRLAEVGEAHRGEAIIAARGANRMMLGLILGDRNLFERGYRDGFVAQMQRMAPDGSFGDEAGRADALERRSRNLGLLVYSAEIAASEGIDLYSLRIGGRSLVDAIESYLHATADGTMPAVTRGWALLYVRRFPDSDSAMELASRLNLQGRIRHHSLGGFVSCHAGKVEAGRMRR